MFRRISALIALGLCVLVVTAGNPVESQYIETMTFQEGVSPTSGYTGCEATYFTKAVADSGKNYGAAVDLIVATDALLSSDSSAVLIQFDIGDLPDSAVIVNARLWMYQTGPASTIAAGLFGVRRLLRDWTEGTGNGTASVASATYFTATATSKWFTVGAGGSAQGTQNWRPGTSASSSDSSTAGTAFYGTDTLSVATATTDINYNHVTQFPYKRGATAATRLGWVAADVTQAVRLWHTGAVQNHGVKITAVDSAAPAPASTFFTFASDNYTTDKRRRPKLVVQYIDPEEVEAAGGGGGVRRTIGGRGR